MIIDICQFFIGIWLWVLFFTVPLCVFGAFVKIVKNLLG